MILRAYHPTDRDACLAIFDSNVPRYFSPPERSDFDAYLTRMPGAYSVLVDGETVTGCGGWAPSKDPRIANLCWGMIHASAHRRGLGRLLLRSRLAEMRAARSIDTVELSTSQHTPDFFSREGFEVIGRRENGFAPGLHAVDMRLDVRLPTLHDVLFDLDGTLTDSFEGIARSFEHALRALGRTAPPESALRAMVGPPLRANFIELLGKDGPIEDAIRIFRERYGTVGMFESRVYAGIADTLSALKCAGVRSWLCTSKRRDFAERILEHFELRDFFLGVYGTEPDGRFENKIDLAHHILESNGIDPRHAALVGDREQDMLAARATSILAIGVTYGYGSLEELASSGAHVLCATPKGIENLTLKK